MSPEINGFEPVKNTTKEKLFRPLAAVVLSGAMMVSHSDKNYASEPDVPHESTFYPLLPDSESTIRPFFSRVLEVEIPEEGPLSPTEPQLLMEVNHSFSEGERVMEEERIAEEKRVEEAQIAEEIRLEQQRIEEENIKKLAAPPQQSGAVVSSLSTGTKILTDGTDVWTVLADCESGDAIIGAPYYVNWEYNGSSGFDGAFQFLPSTWNSLNITAGYDFAWQAPPHIQIAAAIELQARSGWGQWPHCTNRMRSEGYIK